MNKNYYDVVVIGTELGGLVAATLLCTRGFRVLILGDDDLPYTYWADDIELPRYPYTFLGTDSPAIKRVFAELSLSQTFRRKALMVDPSFQVVVPDHRIDFATDESVLLEELSRELEISTRDAGIQHQDLMRINDAFTDILNQNLVWPPHRFLEKRQWNRAEKLIPKQSVVQSFLERLMEFPLWRTTFSLLQRFSIPAVYGNSANPWCIARTYSKWTRGNGTLMGGYRELQEIFVDKIQSLGGSFLRSAKVEQLVVRKGAVTAIRINQDDVPIQCKYVVAAMPIAKLFQRFLSHTDSDIQANVLQLPSPASFHYTLNLVVRAEGMPLGISRDVFYVSNTHLPFRDANALRMQIHRPDSQNRQIVCVEAIVEAEHGLVRASALTQMRERVLESVRAIIPFLDSHLLLIDSPHDGIGTHDVVNNETQSPTEPWARGPHTMRATMQYPSLLHESIRSALCAWPIQTPIKGLLFGGNQSIPGLGDEGAFLTGWSVARMISQSDKHRTKLKEGLWKGTEI